MTLFRAALPALLLAACSPAAAPAPPAAEPAAEPAASARLMSPESYVQGFYVNEPDWTTPEAVRALFTPDLAEALIKDRSRTDEVGAVDFMFICGCQDGDIQGVSTTSRDVPGGAEVTARFNLERNPTTIVYRLRRTEQGYRIAEVSSPAEGGKVAWSLRDLLGLPQG